jgi:hypothetical protein
VRRFELALCFAVCLVASDAAAQKLTIAGDRFLVDGTPRFLTMVTYFGGMGAPNIIQDLHLIRSLGFDGFRIWPNLDTGPQLMNADGSLRPEELKRFLLILDQAKLERLIVDVTFTYEHIGGMTPSTARIGIENVTNAVRSYDNLLFDIQNERNVNDRRFMSGADVGRIYTAIKAIDPARIAFADNAPVDPPEYAAQFVATYGLDVTAYHEPRPADWYTLPVTQSNVNALRAAGKPAYLQEPMSTRDDLFKYPSHDLAEYFLEAIANAKLTGAAGWCFHTEVGVDFRSGPPFFEDRLRAYPEPEWAFVSSISPRLVLRANDGTHYLIAEGGGGSGVRADRTAAGPGSWDTFNVVSLTGGPLISGDRVALATNDGKHYLQAVNGGGGALRALSTAISAAETFIIEKPGGGIIRHGDAISLRVADTSWFVSAENAGGGNVSANATSRGAWETFTLLFTTPHISQ